VPFYRAQWEERRRQGDCSSFESLENWPVLEKDSVRKNPAAFVADDCDARRMYHEHTSGTTGKSLDLWWSRKTVRAWYALYEARCRRWYGVGRQNRWAILGGQLITPVGNRRPPFWVWNSALRQLYMSSYHLSPDLIHTYLKALKRYRVRYMLGYTSSLYELGLEVIKQGRKDIKMEVVVTNAEPVFDYQRQVIAEAFQCPVRETYGMAEIVAAASECGAGHLHLWPEVGLIETLNDGLPTRGDVAGDFICTGLLNEDMPLVRYRMGDRGRLGAGVASGCGCGRQLPQLDALEGRADDTLYTMEGRRIGRLDPVFKSRLAVDEAQIIQESLGRVRVRFVPATGYNEASGRSIISRLKERIGDVEVILEPVRELPRGANGKFRAVVCRLSPDELNLVRGRCAQGQ
jgi:phenylacetate-CoA ligase